MIINFKEMQMETYPQFKGGEKQLDGKMFFDESNRMIYGKLEPGASIGLHTHETNSEIIYVLAGEGTVLMDGEHEAVEAGVCHYCPKGHTHSLINSGGTDLVFFAVVPEQ